MNLFIGKQCWLCIFLSGARPQGGGKKIDTENLLRDNLLLNQQQNNRWSERDPYMTKPLAFTPGRTIFLLRLSVLYLPLP